MNYFLRFKKGGDPLHVGPRLGGFQVVADERAFAVPAHHHASIVAVPHHRDRIEPAIQGTVFEDTALAGFRLKGRALVAVAMGHEDRKSTRLNSSHGYISYAVFCLKKKKKKTLI